MSERAELTYRAVFYWRGATGTLEESHIVEAAPSLAEFRRRAQQTAHLNGWRLVECKED